MSTPVTGAGFLIANDRLTDAAYALFQPSVSTLVPSGGISAGTSTVAAYDAAMYPGAKVVVGSAGTSNIEVVTISSTVVGTSFTATFSNAHVAGEMITGATFPIRQSTDPLFTQDEMISYLSTACNDFLTDCPLCYYKATLTVPPTVGIGSLPSDCMKPVRMAYSDYPLHETSQSNLDAMMYQWSSQASAEPEAYYRDKLSVLKFGITPRPSNTTPIECIYQQRQAATMGIADGFLFPDPFTAYVLYRTLSFAYSKDGDMRSPGLAKYFQKRYEMGVKISNMILGAVSDPNLQMESQE